MTNKIENFNEFIPLALRTESQIDSIKTSKNLIVSLLAANIAIAEILDAVKKQVFYGNAKKLNDSGVSNALDARSQIDSVNSALASLRLSPEDLDTEIAVNPRVFHGLLGIITESGELAQVLLNAILTDGNIDAINVAEELSDASWYEAILDDELKIDHYQALTNVINKLRIRYPEKFSAENAANRNLDAERQALEGNA